MKNMLKEYNIDKLNPQPNPYAKKVERAKKEKRMEVYESHLGGIYFSDEIYDFDFLYCDQCGDSDTHLGHADTWEEVLAMITDVYEDGEEWCPYDAEYLEELKAEFEKAVSES